MTTAPGADAEADSIAMTTIGVVRGEGEEGEGGMGEGENVTGQQQKQSFTSGKVFKIRAPQWRRIRLDQI